MKKFLLLIPVGFLLSGCLGDWMEFGCEFTNDESHCYQAAAVQESDQKNCEKVTSDFPKSNPPRDKCHLMIAENRGDPTLCDEIKGGPASYTQEQCISNTISKNTPEKCTQADDETACRTLYALNHQGCGTGFDYDLVVEQCVSWEDQSSEKNTDHSDSQGISEAEKEDILTLRDALGGKYMELLRTDFEQETNPSKKSGLEAYINFLDQSSEKIDEAQANWDQLQAMKRVFLETYDESMSIENMSIDSILDPGYYDQVKDRILGPKKLTGIAKENSDANDALKIYERLLEQQSENDFLKQNRSNRLKNTIIDTFKNDVTEKVVENATGLAEATAGKAFGAVTAIKDALQAFQDEAKKQTFIGLTRAYNRRRNAIEKRNPELPPAEVHRQTVHEVKADPYQDLKGLSPIRFENLLDNDCQNYKGALCIDPHVWWVSLDKTYRYHQKQLNNKSKKLDSPLIFRDLQ